LEAAACGVPIVTTRVGNMPEFVEEGVSGLFIDRDPDSLAERLAFLRDAPALRAALGRGARRAAERWDWRRRAEHYAAMFESLLAAGGKRDRDDRREGPSFRSAADLYLASADRMDAVERNLAELARRPPPRGGRYATVIGGLSGLNYLLRLAPKEVVFFDVNTAALAYARLIVELIGLSADHRDFTGRVFGRSVERFLAETGERELSLGNQRRYLARPAEAALVDDTRQRLSPAARETFDATLAAFLPGRTVDGARNCRRLLPCWPAAQRVPVGGGLAEGDDEWGRSIPNTNTLFYGHGWLASAEAFRTVKRALAAAEVRFAPFDVFDGDLDQLSGGPSTAPDPLAIHVSNIDDWFPDRFAATVRRWREDCLREQRPLTVITAVNGVQRLDADPHAWALAALRPYVFGKVVEVTLRVPWGFHELERVNVTAERYAAAPVPAETTILHILAGEGGPRDLLARCYRQALAHGSRVLVLEHDPASDDWDDDARARMLDRSALLELVRNEVAAGRRGRLTAVRAVRGERDGRRNVLLVVDSVPVPEGAAAGTARAAAAGLPASESG
ncbi:MAG: glycosyltransferase, partial [Acidobacteria bacterium]